METIWTMLVKQIGCQETLVPLHRIEQPTAWELCELLGAEPQNTLCNNSWELSEQAEQFFHVLPLVSPSGALCYGSSPLG